MSPENRLAEIICGLVMVLTFTTTTNAAFTDITPRQLLIAVLGCNIAWGIVDGVTYILGNLLTRANANKALLRLQQAQSDDETGHEIDALIGENIQQFISPENRREMQQWIKAGAIWAQPQPVRVNRQDIYTAIACFLIVFTATLPLAVPFMFIPDKTLALEVSNYLGLGLLFFIGYRWGISTGVNRWKIGFSMLFIGGILVAITVALGG
jgi:VIT1/CCC1 family predicted Fe2+/Mn2+ transporter